jgi:hypothetical protein
MFGIVVLSARKKTGNDTSCSAERNEEFPFQFLHSRFSLVEGPVCPRSPMDKDSNNFDTILKLGDASFDAGMYRDALPKFETALTALQKLGHDEKKTFAIHRRIIACHERLLEVSIAELSWLGRKADDFSSLSIGRFYVAATSWSLW